MWMLRYLSVSWCYTGRPTKWCTFKSHRGPSIFHVNQFQQYWPVPVVNHPQLTKCIYNVQTKLLQDSSDSRPIILTPALSLDMDEKIMHEGLALYNCSFNEFKGILVTLLTLKNLRIMTRSCASEIVAKSSLLNISPLVEFIALLC